MNLRIDIAPNRSVVVHLGGQLDAASSGFVKRQVVALTRTGFFRGLILDLTQVSWIDRAGLALLRESAQAVRGMGGELRLASAGEQLQPLLIPITNQVPCFDSVEAAIAGDLLPLAAMHFAGATYELA